MTNITQKVWNIILQEPTIKKDLRKGLINIRALAKYIIKRYNINASLDAVITAIRRYLQEDKFEKEEQEISDTFKDANLSTKNNIVCITLNKNQEILECLAKLLTIKDFSRKETFRLTMGRNDIKIMLDKINLKKARSVFPEKSIISIDDNLSELSLFVSAKAKQTKGVIARIANEIAINNVNMVEIIPVVPEILIYVKQEDLLRTHESLIKLIS